MVDNEFLELVEKYRHEFYAFAQRNVWNPSHTEDVFSAAIVSAYEKRHSFRAGSNFRAWICKFLVNKCYTANKQQENVSLDVEQVEAHIEPETITLDILQNPDGFMEHCDDKVVMALGHLRSEERACFLLLSLGGYSYKEIAGITDMPRATVMTHLARGRVKLRRSLIRYAQENGYAPQSDSDTTSTKGGTL
ncbi:RNA polymerase sigma factor [Planctomycetota bacterium]